MVYGICMASSYVFYLKIVWSRIIYTLFNIIYICNKNIKKYILRISTEKSYNEILSEIQWICFLKNEKVNVPTIIVSKNNNQIEFIKKDEFLYYGVLFEYIEGKHITYKELTNELIVHYGKLTGKLHRLNLKYEKYKASAREDGLNPISAVYSAEKGFAYCQTEAESAD